MAGEQFSAMTNTAPLVRSWRTAFLTLRDETSSHPTATLSSVVPLLDELVFAQFHSFVTAAASLPSHEVTSDIMYLMKLAASSCGDENMERVLSLICHLVHNITLRVALDLSPSAWSEMLGSFSKVTKFFIKDAGKRQLSENSVAIKAILDCLESTRHLIGVEPRRSSILENNTVVEFLLHTVICCHSELNGYGPSREDVRFSNASRNRFDQQSSLLKVQTTAFSMVDEAFSRVGSSFSIEMWQSIVEVLRKVMDSLAAKTFPSENGTLSRFYTSLLRCLHTVLVNRKDSVSDHLAAFIAALKMFLGYGLNNSSLISRQIERDPAPSSPKFNSAETVKKVVGAYRPPHLRGRNRSSLQQTFTQTLSDHDSSPVEFSSSDSDYSDSDGSLKDTTHICKARVAAITCIQDLCEADPKAFIAQWTMLLPTSDALQPRKYEATLMTCLLYDPFLKVRLASASTIAAMLEGPSPAALQFAEYKESSKCGSFTALSSSLGQILMQLHAGVLYLIEHEKHSGLLTSLFKILTLLISSTPYSRMPGELLPRVLSSLKLKIEEGFPQQRDQTSFLAVAISCLTASVSTTPPSLHVNEILRVEISTGLCGGKGGSGILTTLILYAEKVTNTTLCLEALQALKAFCHNYPTIMALCWKQISSLAYNFLKPDTFVFPSLKGAVGRDIGSTVDKVVSGAVKVLDECLRAVSGFKGTEDLFGDGLMESPFASEFVRDKKISSAPSYGSGGVGISNDNLSGIREWSEALDKHIAISIHHASGMVRAASITCFAGITCSVFSSLEKQQQHFILHSCTDGANDLVPSVRSAACRAIGVIACFPEILRSAEILHKFINAVEVNTRDQPVMVRITASWAMANICDAFRHSVSNSSIDLEANIKLLFSLLECALHLARDGDKIKSNAVRALGNLSRVVPFDRFLKRENCEVRCSGTSKEFASVGENCSKLGCMHLLERIVQTFLSCITTGNVKVQWNVCHALSNLFLNASLRTLPMDWASPIFSILLLLLRDSSNFKIRIQAAAALAVPSTVSDYGSSFSDIIRGIENILENALSDQNSTPNFKYRIALEKQLTASMLHVLSLCSSSSQEPVKDFLLKKASFFERWLNGLCSSLETSEGNGVDSSLRNQKRVLLSNAIQSLVEVLESKNQFLSAEKLQKLLMICG